jgi:PAS domain S-box-containing protein
MSRPEKSLRSSAALHIESEVLFFDVFENAPHAMALVGADGTLLHVNRALCLMLGYGRDELIDANIGSITHPDDLQTGWVQRQRLANANIGRYELTQRYLRKPGDAVWVRQSVSAIRHFSQLAYFVVEVEAVSEPRSPQGQGEEGQALRQLCDAALSAVHEIGNALTPLMLNTELIVEQTRNEHVHEFAAEVFKAARRIAFTLRRMRRLDDAQPVAYIGEQRMLDLRMLQPKSDKEVDGVNSTQDRSLDRKAD